MNFSPKEAVLCNDQLLTLVFRNFLPPDPTSLPNSELAIGRKDLRKIAGVCKAFKNPAVDRLWACIDSLLPLLKTLPNFQLVGNSYSFRGDLPADSTIFQHSRRVRVIRLAKPMQDQHQVLPHVYVLLAKSLEGRPLFPGLRKIICEPEIDLTDDLASAFPVIFSPSVTSASFFGPVTCNPLFPTFTLPLAAQELRCLDRLSVRSSSPAISENVVPSIIQMRRLRSLTLVFPKCDKLRPSVLVKMGMKLTELENLVLDVHFPSHQVSDWISLPSHKVTFPSLKSAKVVSRGGGGLSICPCIPPSIISKLSTIAIIIATVVRDSTFFLPFMDVLTACHVLEEIELVGERKGRIKEPDALIPFFSQTRSLKGFVVEDLVIGPGARLTKSFRTLKEEQKFWESPQIGLKSLVLPAHPRKEPSKYDDSDLVFLYRIATTLKSLESLSIGVDHDANATSTMKLWLTETVCDWRSRSNLRRLAIRDCQESMTFTTHLYNDLAIVIDRLFPRLESIEPYTPEESSKPYWKDHWWFVEDSRKMRRKIREAEQENQAQMKGDVEEEDVGEALIGLEGDVQPNVTLGDVTSLVG